MTSLVIRPAHAEDEAQLLPLMWGSSTELLEHCLRLDATDPLEVIRADFRRGQGLFGLRHQTVAVAPDGRIVGTVTLYEGRRAIRLLFETARSVHRVLGFRRTLIVLARAVAIGRLFIPPDSDGLFVANACVSPEARGRRVFGTLLEHAKVRARAAGLRVIEADVSLSNERSARAFARAGFVPVAERRSARARGALEGFRRISFGLTPGDG